jgi:hypothetical protein
MTIAMLKVLKMCYYTTKGRSNALQIATQNATACVGTALKFKVFNCEPTPSACSLFYLRFLFQQPAA